MGEVTPYTSEGIEEFDIEGTMAPEDAPKAQIGGSDPEEEPITPSPEAPARVIKEGRPRPTRPTGKITAGGPSGTPTSRGTTSLLSPRLLRLQRQEAKAFLQASQEMLH